MNCHLKQHAAGSKEQQHKSIKYFQVLIALWISAYPEFCTFFLELGVGCIKVFL